MKPQQKALIRKAQDSFRAAILLQSEGLFDFAASRAYYSMFYIAQVFLLEQDLSFSSHSAVISAFGKNFAKTGIVPIELHRWLIEAQSQRTQGDYEVEESISADELADLLKNAQVFLDVVKQTIQ